MVDIGWPRQELNPRRFLGGPKRKWWRQAIFQANPKSTSQTTLDAKTRKTQVAEATALKVLTKSATSTSAIGPKLLPGARAQICYMSLWVSVTFMLRCTCKVVYLHLATSSSCGASHFRSAPSCALAFLDVGPGIQRNVSALRWLPKNRAVARLLQAPVCLLWSHHRSPSSFSLQKTRMFHKTIAPVDCALGSWHHGICIC